jgi:hypothetical protein
MLMNVHHPISVHHLSVPTDPSCRLFEAIFLPRPGLKPPPNKTEQASHFPESHYSRHRVSNYLLWLNRIGQLHGHLEPPMVSYSYQPLKTELEEIRLIRLQPGAAGERLRLEIFHASLKQPVLHRNRRRDTLEKLQETLPHGHVVKETLDGRYIFDLGGTKVTPSSWDHPVQGFHRARYELQEDDYMPGPGYEPKYEALSYTWGSELPSTEADVSSGVTPGCGFIPMTLGGNLASALKHLRYKDNSRVLWVDAICINQTDIEERNHQVKRMGGIYSLARRVIVWLGPESEESTHALSTLQSFANQVEMTIDNSLHATPGALEPDWYHPIEPLPPNMFNERTWSSIRLLFSRPWFTRVWVTQEVALANRFTELHCGRFSMPWLDLRKAIGILHAKKGTPAYIKAILDPQVPGIPPTTTRSLLRLFTFIRRRHCQVPHDKVFGIWSLVSPDLSSLIDPKYEEPVTQVLSNVSLAHLKLTKRLELLQFCSISRPYPGAPSWVPNWEGGHTALFGLRTGHMRQATGQSAAHHSLLCDNTLQVAGVRCACIKLIGNTAEGSVDQIFDVIRTWEPEGLREDNYKPGGAMIDAFLEAVFQGCLRNRFPRALTWPAFPELREHYLALLSGADRRAGILKYLQNGVAEGATFFTTTEGYFGVAARGVNQGT